MRQRERQIGLGYLALHFEHFFRLCVWEIMGVYMKCFSPYCEHYLLQREVLPLDPVHEQFKAKQPKTLNWFPTDQEGFIRYESGRSVYLRTDTVW